VAVTKPSESYLLGGRFGLNTAFQLGIVSRSSPKYIELQYTLDLWDPSLHPTPRKISKIPFLAAIFAASQPRSLTPCNSSFSLTIEGISKPPRRYCHLTDRATKVTGVYDQMSRGFKSNQWHRILLGVVDVSGIIYDRMSRGFKETSGLEFCYCRCGCPAPLFIIVWQIDRRRHSQANPTQNKVQSVDPVMYLIWLFDYFTVRSSSSSSYFSELRSIPGFRSGSLAKHSSTVELPPLQRAFLSGTPSKPVRLQQIRSCPHPAGACGICTLSNVLLAMIASTFP
jgi:hypothetical protein